MFLYSLWLQWDNLFLNPSEFDTSINREHAHTITEYSWPLSPCSRGPGLSQNCFVLVLFSLVWFYVTILLPYSWLIVSNFHSECMSPFLQIWNCRNREPQDSSLHFSIDLLSGNKEYRFSSSIHYITQRIK